MKKQTRSKRALPYITLGLILFLILGIYYYISPGISMGFDDSIYAYSTINTNVLKTISWGVVAYGFKVLTLPFYILFDHSVFVTKYVCLLSLAATCVAIFLILKIYNSPFAGILAILLYAFNPLTFANTIRYIPDPFVTMCDAIGILIAVYAASTHKKWIFAPSGLIVALGFFFGNQAAISIIAFTLFVPFLWYSLESKKHDKKRRNYSVVKEYAKIFAWLFLGILIVVGIYFLIQVVEYHDFLYSVTNEAMFYKTHVVNNYPNYIFYFYALLPSNSKSLTGSIVDPYLNLGILPSIFITALAYEIYVSIRKGSKRKASKVIPYFAFFIAFLLYVMFGSESVTFYIPIQNLSRVLMPLVLIISVGTAIAISEIKNRTLKLVIGLGIIVVYLALSYAPCHTIISFYNSPPTSIDWAITQSVIKNFGMLNLSKFVFYENYSNMGYIACMSFNSPPPNCKGIPMPKISCNQSNVFAVYVGPQHDICAGNNGYYYYNSTYKYSVYINPQ